MGRSSLAHSRAELALPLISEGEMPIMSDDISMSDYMAIQNAALDASINRNAMRIAANQRNQQQKSNPVIAYIEKDKTPIVRNGFVYANAYLRHRADNPNCSVRQGRQVKVMEFEDRSAYNAFADNRRN